MVSRPADRGGASRACRILRPRRITDLEACYSVFTAFLYATQEPFSFPAAKHLSTLQFVCLTQIALLISIPLVTWRPASRRDFVALLRDRSNYGKLAVIFAIGMTGLLLVQLRPQQRPSDHHIGDLEPVAVLGGDGGATIMSRVPIPVSPTIFFGCFAGAFIGAMAVAWSQLGDAGKPTMGQLADNFLHGSWVYAIPVPLCSALGGTLIGKWFARYEESAAVAANFFVANRDPDPHDCLHLVPALRASIRRSVRCGRSDDRRHDHRVVGRPRLLSDRADRHRRRQRLRHDVLESGAGAHRSDVAASCRGGSPTCILPPIPCSFSAWRSSGRRCCCFR